ncbi:hypothetical protein M9Y10_023978 [Tritrichomonas musculus]|uniref:Uncharacterized protein n=1 Tax=Tritrichomonas musculus TaxID=1915356 RepID=A0ABR2KWL7_9EUKA
MKPKTYHKRILDMEDNIKSNMYGIRDISTKCRTRYLLAVSPNNRLTTTTTPLLLYPTDRKTKDFIYIRGGVDDHKSWNEWYKLDETNKICGRDTGKWCFIIEKHGTAYKKCKNLQPVIDIIDVFDYYRKEDKGANEVYETSILDVEYIIDRLRKNMTLSSLNTSTLTVIKPRRSMR